MASDTGIPGPLPRIGNSRKVRKAVFHALARWDADTSPSTKGTFISDGSNWNKVTDAAAKKPAAIKMPVRRYARAGKTGARAFMYHNKTPVDKNIPPKPGVIVNAFTTSSSAPNIHKYRSLIHPSSPD